jgi:hypothetical protein
VELMGFQYVTIGIRIAVDMNTMVNSMLKIERSARGEFVVFSLSGRIGIDDVAQLERLFEAEDHSVIMDLKEVTLVDRKTVRFLTRCESGNIKVENCPAYIREWIARERDQKTVI